MLKHRIIPILLYDGAFCVHTTRFKRPARRIGPVMQYTNNMASRDIDELVFLDIEATKRGQGINFQRIAGLVDMLACPVAYGGGIKSLKDIRTLIRDCGVDKVILRTNYNLIRDAIERHGKQSVVYAMDVKGNKVLDVVGGLNINPEEWAVRMQDWGAGEIILTGVENQGMMQGYDNLLINRISKVVNIPLVANGGCGGVGDMVIALSAGADAIAASSVFTLRGLTPQEAAVAVSKAGYPTRVSPLAQDQEGRPEPQEPQPEGPTEDV